MSSSPPDTQDKQTNPELSKSTQQAPIQDVQLKKALISSFVTQNWSPSATELEKCKTQLELAKALVKQNRLTEAEAALHQAIDPLDKKCKSLWKKKQGLESQEFDTLLQGLELLETVYRGQVKNGLAGNIHKRIEKTLWIRESLQSEQTG